MKYGKKEIAVKSVVTLAWIIIICAAESTFIADLRLLGRVPSSLPFVVAAAAVLDGPCAGLICGAVAGFFMDGICGQSYCLYSVVYLLCGAAVGALSPELFRKSFLTICGWGGIIYFISEFTRFFFFFYLFGKAGFAAVFTVILPGLLYSLIVSPLAAAPALFMRNRFKRDMPLIR